MANWSTIATIVYFCVYTTMMILLAMFVWKKEDHKLDRTFLKSIWIQRKIYAQVIVHFYDTATDIGVIITWYFLYTDDYDYESVDMAVFFFGGCAVALLYRFMTLLVFMWKESIEGAERHENNVMITVRACLKSPLIILDMFILEAVYESFKSAEQILEDNVAKAKAKRERSARKKTQTLWKMVDAKLVVCLLDKVLGNVNTTFAELDSNNDGVIDKAELKATLKKYDKFTDEQITQCFKEIDRNKDGTIDSEDFSKWYKRATQKQKKNKTGSVQTTKQVELTTNIKTVPMESANEENVMPDIERTNTVDLELDFADVDLELDDIDPSIIQLVIMLAEAVFESMPQVILQAVFLLRGANDEKLSKNSNQVLIFISLLASIFSVSNKFYLMDRLGVESKAQSLKPKKQFPNCVQPWYVTRIIWRFCHILCRFSIYTLLWVVLGGLPFGIYVALSACGLWSCLWFCCLHSIAMCVEKLTYDRYRYSSSDKVVYSWIFVAKIVDGTDDQLLLFIFLGTVALPLINKSLAFYTTRWIENGILLGVIFYFCTNEFPCTLCTDETQRQVSNNKSVLALLIIGFFSCFVDVCLFLLLQCCGIILDEPKNLPGSSDD
eukprot:202447_1